MEDPLSSTDDEASEEEMESSDNENWVRLKKDPM
jgi:hypothetical protein